MFIASLNDADAAADDDDDGIFQFISFLFDLFFVCLFFIYIY
jgi:hypothetical protein